jgi:hypothetical protein
MLQRVPAMVATVLQIPCLEKRNDRVFTVGALHRFLIAVRNESLAAISCRFGRFYPDRLAFTAHHRSSS